MGGIRTSVAGGGPAAAAAAAADESTGVWQLDLYVASGESPKSNIPEVGDISGPGAG